MSPKGLDPDFVERIRKSVPPDELEKVSLDLRSLCDEIRKDGVEPSSRFEQRIEDDIHCPLEDVFDDYLETLMSELPKRVWRHVGQGKRQAFTLGFVSGEWRISNLRLVRAPKKTIVEEWGGKVERYEVSGVTAICFSLIMPGVAELNFDAHWNRPGWVIRDEGSTYADDTVWPDGF